METTIKTWFLLLPDETVAERVKEFREKYPDWKILPEIIEFAPEWIVMKAVQKSPQPLHRGYIERLIVPFSNQLY